MAIYSPYKPSVLSSIVEGTKTQSQDFLEFNKTNLSNTSSFLYDPSNYPIKNTQQINVDWSKFENHTFFSSAEAKVNIAFEQIINKFPFDGSKIEIERFFENITGFERWVFDQFPRYKGQLLFSSSYLNTIDGTTGTWITINDQAGSTFSGISNKNSGESLLNPKGKTSFTIETHIFIPTIANGNQTIFQKLSDKTHGMSLHLISNATTTDVQARFSVVNGSRYLDASANLQKGKFNHICVSLNREQEEDFIEFYIDSKLVSRSKNSWLIGDMPIDTTKALIGSGTEISYGNVNFLPSETLSGSLDEFRIFHSIRTEKQQKLFAKKTVYSTPELKLYYKFNEPPPPLTSEFNSSIDGIVLDSSGNSLHASINNFYYLLRQNAATDSTNPMIYEKSEMLPVLFPAYPDVVALNNTLLQSAIDYDKNNPNLITKLVPKHYFLEAEQQDGFSIDNDTANSYSYSGDGLPKQGKLSPSQIIVSFLYIWAKFFDEIKIIVDSFGTLGYVDYSKYGNTPSNFLFDIIKSYGFEFPDFFKNSTIEQYVNAENITEEIATSAYPLKQVQNELLKRVLINIPEIIRSKGTQHSIKVFLRSIGIDPENSFRIREFGGPTNRQLTFARERKMDLGSMVQFTDNSSIATSFLSSSRIEVGYPQPVGNMVLKKTYSPHGISDQPSDGLLTSGSWHVESIYKLSKDNLLRYTTQSLLRLCTTGSFGTSCVANLIGMFSSDSSKLVLHVRPGARLDSPRLALELPLPPKDVFDDSRWNISFGCQRNDSINSVISSSYYIKAGTQNNGEITYFFSTSSFFQENPIGELNVFRDVDTTYNISGTFITVGNQTLDIGTTGYRFLNNTSYSPNESRITSFNGRISNLRFWSKSFDDLEWKEHIRNYKSRGVQNPLLNYNFVTKATGSWEKLRLETLTKQEVRKADTNGDITFLDFSQNNKHTKGINFPTNKPCAIGEVFDHSYLSPYYDEASTTEKIRIRSYLDYDLVKEKPWAMPAPVHEILASERPNDDVRFSIEFSLIDALNRDIVTIFSTFDALDNALGSPELVYSPDYPDLDKLKEIYFNRISNKINFQSFFEFYRWFDRSLGNFIEQLIPRKTKFKGTNFVVESHMLERSKLQYLSTDIYMGESDRNKIKTGTFLLQQVVGTIKKYLYYARFFL